MSNCFLTFKIIFDMQKTPQPADPSTVQARPSLVGQAHVAMVAMTASKPLFTQ